MIYDRIQMNKKVFIIDENSDIFDSNIEMLFLKYLDFYLAQSDYDKIVNLYTEKPECITNLGYRSLGNLIVKNIKFAEVCENEYLYLATMSLDFDLNKLDDSVCARVVELFDLISSLFRMQKEQRRTRQLVA